MPLSSVMGLQCLRMAGQSTQMSKGNIEKIVKNCLVSATSSG